MRCVCCYNRRRVCHRDRRWRKKPNDQKADAEVTKKRMATVPAKRFGTPDEFGAACAFLCSAQAGYITGQNLLIDGGVFPGAI